MRGTAKEVWVTTAPPRLLEPFVGQWAVLLTTYKRDGTPIGTPVNIAVDGDRAFVRTFDTAWKLKRIRNRPEWRSLPPRGVAALRVRRSAPVQGCSRERSPCMPDACSPTSTRCCTASSFRLSTACGATRRYTSS